MERSAPERDLRARLPGDRWWCAAMIAVLVVPLVVSAVHLLTTVGSDYYPTTDWALLELRTRDVGEHLVAVGPYSRFNWNHPGPLLFYVLYGPYKLLGSRSIALHVGALMVNAAAVVGIGLVAFRRGRLPVAIAVLVPLGLLTHALGAQVLRDPWNPFLPVLALLLLLLLAWSVAVGDLWMAPIAVGVASFTVQSHAGFAAVTLALLGAAALVVLGRGLRVAVAERRAYWRRVVIVGVVSGAVGLLLWAPVLYGTFVRHDGNLAAMRRFFTGEHETASLTTALEVMGLQWGPRPEWILGPRGAEFRGTAFLEPRWWLAFGLAAAGAATVVAFRRRDRVALWFAMLLGVGFAAGVYAVSGIVGPLFPYLVRWTWVLGAGIGMLVLLAAWTALAPSARSRVLRPAAVVAVLGLGVLGVVETLDALDAGTPYEVQQPGERAMARQVLPAVPAGDRPVLVEDAGGTFAVPGLVDQLERHGIETVVAPDQPVIYGKERSPTGGPYRAVLRVYADRATDDPAPAGERIAVWTRPRSARERRDLEEFIATVRDMPEGAERDELLHSAKSMRGRPAEHYEVYLEE